MGKLLLFLLFSFYSIVNAESCYKDSQRLEIESVLEISRFRNVWTGYDEQKFLFVFSNALDGSTLVAGASEAELSVANINFDVCEPIGGQSIFKINSPVNIPENGLYDIRLPDQPGTDVLGKYVIANKQSIIQIKQSNDFGFSNTQVARVAIHEGFHGVYQFFSGKFKVSDPQPREFLETCVANETWQLSTIKQNRLLAQSLVEVDLASLKDKLSQILNERNKLLSNDEAASCLKAQRFWERLEGSAHFVETEAALKSGILSQSDFKTEMETTLEDSKLSDDFFYKSGNALIRLILAIYGPSAIQQINQGIIIEHSH